MAQDSGSLPSLELLWRYGRWWRCLILGLLLAGASVTPRSLLFGLGSWHALERSPASAVRKEPADPAAPDYLDPLTLA